MKTIIVGLGNPLYCDDGVGLLVARAIKNMVYNPDITVVEATIAGLDILDIITDYNRAIIIDAVRTEQQKPGMVYRFDIDQVISQSSEHPHSIDYLASLKLGKQLGLALPEDIIFFGIEAQNVEDLNEGCTPKISTAIQLCVNKIMTELVQN